MAHIDVRGRKMLKLVEQIEVQTLFYMLNNISRDRQLTEANTLPEEELLTAFKLT